MAGLNLKVQLQDAGTLDRAFDRRIQRFIAEAKTAQITAAQEATALSRRNYKRVRPLAPKRARREGDGRMTQHIEWTANPNRKSMSVFLELKKLDAAAPHWIIQEIGTGERAVIRSPGRTNPRGRPAAGATYVRTVRSQVGRRISSGLVFATKGGQWSPPGTSRGQQLYARQLVNGVPYVNAWSRTRSQPGIIISKEIEGQHFVKKGGKQAFRQYKKNVLSAARKSFKRGR